MVLDSGDEVYVWVGRGSDDQEKEKAFAMAEVSLVHCSIFQSLLPFEDFILYYHGHVTPSPNSG